METESSSQVLIETMITLHQYSPKSFTFTNSSTVFLLNNEQFRASCSLVVHSAVYVLILLPPSFSNQSLWPG